MKERNIMMIHFIHFFLLMMIFGGLLNTTRSEVKLIKLSKLEMFVDDVPNIPKLKGYDVVNGSFVPKHLKIGMFQKKWKFHRDIPRTPVFAFGTSKYAATVPGPTLEAIHGVDTYVRWENHLPKKHILPIDWTIPTAKPTIRKGIPAVVHLHGCIGAPDNDGHAKAWFIKGFKDRGPTWSKKTYRYNNQQQPGNLWYHDHAMGLTRVNLLAGLVGGYIIRQPDIEAPLGLPSGDEFDQTLVLFDRSFRTDGSLFMSSTGNNPSIHPQWQPEYFGDAIIVNGKAWPRMIVRRRKYRFRVINTSNARFFKLFFTNGLNLILIGSDSVYLERPVTVKEILLAPSEIVDFVVDFSESKSDWAILANGAPYPYPSGDPVNEANSKVMKFIIKKEQEVEQPMPNKLIAYPRPDLSSNSGTRYISLYEYKSNIDEPTHLYINGKSFEAPTTETPKVGTSEIWNVINLTEDNHPFHIHLGLFVVLGQTELVGLDEFKDCMTKVNDAIKCNISKYAHGKKVEVVEHEKGWKNVYKMQPGFVTNILVKFAYIHSNASYSFDATSEPGYSYHCHILDHEDNVMMRPLKLIK